MLGYVIAWFQRMRKVKRHLLTRKGAVVVAVFVVVDLVGSVVDPISNGNVPRRKISSVSILAAPSHMGMLLRTVGRILRMLQRGPVGLFLRHSKKPALLRCLSKESC